MEIYERVKFVFRSISAFSRIASRRRTGHCAAHAPEAAPVPPPSLSLPGSFWQAVSYGSTDSLLSTADSTRALEQVAAKIGVPIREGETLGVVRAGQLRKLSRERFGSLEAEGAMAALWRAAPASPGAPQLDLITFKLRSKCYQVLAYVPRPVYLELVRQEKLTGVYRCQLVGWIVTEHLVGGIVDRDLADVRSAG